MTFIHVTYLTMALLSLTTYLVALGDLHANPPHEQLAYHGLMRTALSRVGVGLMYSTIGVLLVWWSRAPDWAGLVGFVVAALVWMLNSRLDVRLKSRLDQKGTP
jgi:hypothetical protein